MADLFIKADHLASAEQILESALKLLDEKADPKHPAALGVVRQLIALVGVVPVRLICHRVPLVRQAGAARARHDFAI